MIKSSSATCGYAKSQRAQPSKTNQTDTVRFQQVAKQHSSRTKSFCQRGQSQQAHRNSSNSNIIKTNAAAAAKSINAGYKLDIPTTKQLVQVISSFINIISDFQKDLGAQFEKPNTSVPGQICIPGHGGNSGDIIIDISIGSGGSSGGNPTTPITFAKPDAGEAFTRLAPANYERTTENGLPGPREISNAVADQKGAETSNANGASDLLWSWGQFVDHDMTLSKEGHEKSVISVPKGDPGMDPTGTGAAFIPFTKSDTVLDTNGVGQQTNEQSPLIDASMVYGTSKEQTDGMRELSGGRMKLEDGFLPASNDKNLVLAGDPRAAEQPGLLSLQTLFVREHNRLADNISTQNPLMSDEKIFQQARKMVGAEIQAITYNEFLPTLIGGNPERLGYTGSGANDGKVSNEFATAAYRLGHTLVSEKVAFKNPDGSLNQATLDEVFFKPEFTKEKGIGAILSGQSAQTAEKADPQIVDGLRDRLFGGPGSPGMDLAALNIERGRDHGLPSYNEMREVLGFSRITSFDDPSFLDGAGAKLASVYGSPDEIDLWVGGLSEKPVGNSMVGQTFTKIVADQFAKTAAADANFYTRSFSYADQVWLKNLSLSDVIRANTQNTAIDNTPFIATD